MSSRRSASGSRSGGAAAMDFKGIRTFVALAEHLHFGQTAEHLRVAQPHVSRRIKQLEEELDAVLFYRDKRNVRLTEAGDVFLVEAKKLLQRRRHRQGARARERARPARQSDHQHDQLGHARRAAGDPRRVPPAPSRRLAVIQRDELHRAPRRAEPRRGRCRVHASADPHARHLRARRARARAADRGAARHAPAGAAEPAVADRACDRAAG